MFFKRLPGALLAAGLLAGMGIVAAAPQASAEGAAEEVAAPVVGIAEQLRPALAAGAGAVTPQESSDALVGHNQTLCTNTVRCGISVPVGTILDGMREGQPFSVNVEGQAGRTVQIRVFAVKRTSATAYDFVPISAPVPATLVKQGTQNFGYARVSVTVATPPAGVDGGEVYIQGADFRKGDSMVGTHADATTSTPQKDWQIYTSRGRDMGFKPTTIGSDGVMFRALDAGLPGQKYGVQLLRNGTWTDITHQGHATVSNRGTASIMGKLPAGLPAGKYRTRLVNVTSGYTDISGDLPWTYFTWSRANPVPGDPDFNVYTQPGVWRFNGRDWKTTCGQYSKTITRCRTEIHATQITYSNGRYTTSKGYVFNNLTYLPSPRDVWGSNPLGGYGKVGFNKRWTATDGRLWRTECDTAASGRGGCRSYIWATVAEQVNGKYRTTQKWLFNNIVQFSG